jgi:hypothetical protein
MTTTTPAAPEYGRWADPVPQLVEGVLTAGLCLLAVLLLVAMVWRSTDEGGPEE